MAQKIVLAGGSGFLGTALAEYLVEKGYEVTVLSRNPSANQNSIKQVYWDGKHLGDWLKEIEGSYAVINFTGKSVNCLYTERNRAEILSSRLDSVNVLREAIQKCEQPPQAFVQAGSLAIFGDTKSVCDEDAPHGRGFSVEVCQQWEETFFRVKLPHTRQVVLRIGFALGRSGGALEPLQKLVKQGLGGTIGKGDQYISWLHIDDLNEMFLMSIEDERISGIYNATGVSPVTNKVFMQTLRKVMGKGWSPPAPTPFVKLGAYLIMRADPSLALTGRNCIPRRLEESGFQFKYTDLEHALRNIIIESR